MAGQTQTFHEGFEEPDRSKTFETTMGGSSLEALGGVGAVVLGIIGLAGVFPHLLLAISLIVLGAAFVSAGAATAARYADLLGAAGGGVSNAVELGGGISTEFIGGVGAIILGILALLGIAPVTLTTVGIIALGVTLLFSSSETSRLASLKGDRGDHTRRIIQASASTAFGGQILLGLGAIVLGILALVMGQPLSLLLALIGVLCVGTSLLFSGAAVTGRLLTLLK